MGTRSTAGGDRRRREGDAADGRGRRGERFAARRLRRKGYRIRARRLRLPPGEIDLLAIDPDGTVVVVEVKSGRRASFAELAARVGPAQSRRLARVAVWLERRPELARRSVRIDFALVRLGRWPRARMEHWHDQIAPIVRGRTGREGTTHEA